MAQSQRVLSGSTVKGSTAILLGSEHSQEDADGFVQGYNVKDFSILSNTLTYKIRSNSGVVRTLAGIDIHPVIFDDSLSPINLTSYGPDGEISGSVRIPAPAIKGRAGERIDHTIEQRDLGQSHLYDDGTAFFEAVNTTNGLEIIGAKSTMELPASLVDHSSVSSLDGKIDPLGIVKSIDRSSLDLPFQAKGVKGMMGIDNDAFHRSYQLAAGLYLSDNENATVPFLDAVEHMTSAPEEGAIYIDLPGAFYQDTSKIKPYSDVSGDIENYMLHGPGKSLTFDPGDPLGDISKILISSSNFVMDNTLQNFDKLTNGGFDFSNDLGTDSLVHGGLLKG